MIARSKRGLSGPAPTEDADARLHAQTRLRSGGEVLIGILILSFAVWGVAGALSGIGTNTVAEVGNTEISVVAFDRAYRRELQNLQPAGRHADRSTRREPSGCPTRCCRG